MVNTPEGLEVEKLNVTDKDEDFVDPWSVSSKSECGVDYDKLIGKDTGPVALWLCVIRSRLTHSCALFCRTFRQLENRRCIDSTSGKGCRSAGSSSNQTWHFLFAPGLAQHSAIGRRRQEILFVHWPRSVIRIVALGPFDSVHYHKVSVRHYMCVWLAIAH